MILSVIPRWVLWAAVAALAAFSAAQTYRLSSATSEATAARSEASGLRLEIAEANARAASQAADLQAQVNRAHHEAKKREATLRAAAASAAAESDGLRGDIETLRDHLAVASRDAAAQRAIAVGTALSHCAKEYQRMAEIADRHASDVKTLRDAWPK